MAVKSLILGIFMALAIFALKAGLGLAYFLPLRTKGKQFLTLLTFALGYGLIFATAWFSGQYLTNNLNLLQLILHTGMTLHFCLACLLLTWGWLLLKGSQPPGQLALAGFITQPGIQPPDTTVTSKQGYKTNYRVAALAGSIPNPNFKLAGTQINPKRGLKTNYRVAALILPCPVCLTVIFISLQLLRQLGLQNGNLIALGSYLGFLGLALITAWAGTVWQDKAGVEGEHFLGQAMLGLAGYFLLAMLIMPQFKDLDNIFHLSLVSGKKMSLGFWTIILWITLGFLFCSSFACTWKKQGDKK